MAPQLARDFAAASGVKISRLTVYRRLAERGPFMLADQLSVSLTASNRKSQTHKS